MGFAGYRTAASSEQKESMIASLSPEIIALGLFVFAFLLLLLGFPVAFTLGGLAVCVGVWHFGIDFFYLLSLRIYGIMSQYVLIAVPLFVYMGMMLEKSRIAEALLITMGQLLARLRAGLLMAVVLVGALLAASTGIVGATVLTLGLVGLPTLLDRGYKPELATGTIAAAGTLGQIIPPSIVLVLLGSVLQVSVGGLFKAAILPGLLLVLLYMAYVGLHGMLWKRHVPSTKHLTLPRLSRRRVIEAFVLPALLVLAVLGSIFAGVASPTEAAGVGALGATLLALYLKKLNWSMLKDVMRSTLHLTSMVFIILVGATAFSLVFRALGGERFLLDWVESGAMSPQGFLLLLMVLVFVAGFFIDFIEITFIIIPIALPLLQSMGIDLYWAGILLALNLQTSFLTPPFGFALFYLKGVCPPQIRTLQLYKGVLPFIILQMIVLLTILAFPEIVQIWK